MRRKFLKTMLSLPFAAEFILNNHSAVLCAQEKIIRTGGSKLKTSLNAYSWNEPLRNGSATLDDLLDYCAELGFDGVDLTGYYFPGYPNVPSDDYIYHIKRKAFLLGLEISGTGVRNDFTYADPEKRKSDVELVLQWIDCAAKLGAPVIRIFAGKQNTDGYSWDQAAEWMVNDIKECVAYGKQRGVIVAIQNHNDFIKTASDAKKILQRVNSPWFGLILDTGSFRSMDPYAEIAEAAPYAVNWQVKENIFVNGVEVPVDLSKLLKIIITSGYRGYLPIETLGAGDPKVKVRKFFTEVKSALYNSKE
jgi:sugar phosphate isomerase/epimerase